MAKCKICGLHVAAGEVYHTDCIGAELDKLRAENSALKEIVRHLDKDCEYCAHNPNACSVALSCDVCMSQHCPCAVCGSDNRSWIWKGLSE